MTDDEFLQKLHHVLLEVFHRFLFPIHLVIACRVTSDMQIHIVEGVMICPNCKHSYSISNGIPNMVSSYVASFGLYNHNRTLFIAISGT